MEASAQLNACPAARFFLSPGDTGWNGWGVDLADTRFQPAKTAGLNREKVARLRLKWAFGFAGAVTAMTQPVVGGGRLFIEGADGTVYSLDAKTGCQYWTFKAPAMGRTAISFEKMSDGSYAAYFGDVKANVYAVNAQNGALLWKIPLDEHPYARITGSPTLHNGRLFVPISSREEAPAYNPKYRCCSFRGSVASIDTKSAKLLWKCYAIPDPPVWRGRSVAGRRWAVRCYLVSGDTALGWDWHEDVPW